MRLRGAKAGFPNTCVERPHSASNQQCGRGGLSRRIATTANQALASRDRPRLFQVGSIHTPGDLHAQIDTGYREPLCDVDFDCHEWPRNTERSRQ
jgi:hypothetical protein